MGTEHISRICSRSSSDKKLNLVTLQFKHLLDGQIVEDWNNVIIYKSKANQ